MNTLNSFKSRFFARRARDLDRWALELFRFQAFSNAVYRRYIRLLGIDPASIHAVEEIPFMPIEFFRDHAVITSSFEAEAIFESSGTTAQHPARHYIEDTKFYNEVASKTFEAFYGPADQYHIIGLLPSYLERKNASLVHMVAHLIERSRSPLSGFFLRDHEGLMRVVRSSVHGPRRLLIIGVTFALMDFADAYPVSLDHAVVIETGGMKGNRPELTREEVHETLCRRFSMRKIHSEYGMTELHSQAYMTESAWFRPPPWMKVLIRDINDPFASVKPGKSGGINVIDLANICSCAFIETADIGVCDSSGRFKVLGRLDNSDVRGCNLMLHYQG